MTEREAIEIIKQVPLYRYECELEKHRQSDLFQALYMAIQALEEIQQYREIGTVDQIDSNIKKLTTALADLVILIEEMKNTIAKYESMGTVEYLNDELYALRAALDFYQNVGSVTECRKAVEQQTPKKVNLYINNDMTCPECGKRLRGYDGIRFSYCKFCGQALER